MSPMAAGLLTVALLAGNAFFVAAEFALVASRRHRLAPAAEAGNKAANAAIHGISHLPLMLAGAQFGITMCSLGLGIVTEPAFEAVLAAPLHAIGVPESGARIIGLVCALAVITFLHMVVGEMAPKSWAIAHPERSALVIARPFGGFVAATRPVLAALNRVTNAMLRAARVHPRDEIATSADPARLTHMLGESRRLGLINRSEHDLLDRAISVRENTIAALTVPAADVTVVPADATPADIRRAAAESGRTRLPVVDAQGVPRGLTHLRDAIVAGQDQVTAEDLLHPMPRLTADVTVLDAVTRLRGARAQLATVIGTDGTYQGIVSLDDLLAQLLAVNPH